MPLTHEQLLTPRVICTGTEGKKLMHGFPMMHGDILTYYKADGWESGVYSDANDFSKSLFLSTRVPESWLTEYPHLFRPLEWWECREVYDFPKYVKLNRTVIEVSYAGENSNGVVLFNSICQSVRLIANECTPATEAEYLEYLNSKNGE